MGRLEFVKSVREILNQMCVDYRLKDKDNTIEFHIYTKAKTYGIDMNALKRFDSITDNANWTMEIIEDFGTMVINNRYNVQIVIHNL